MSTERTRAQELAAQALALAESRLDAFTEDWLVDADVQLRLCAAELRKLEAQRDRLLEMMNGVLMFGRGTSGRIIIEGWQEKVIRAAITEVEKSK